LQKTDVLWFLVLSGIIAFMMAPSTHAIFVSFTTLHPYISGFLKFLILASMGELLAIRIVNGYWTLPQGFIYRAIIWGIIGIYVVLTFGVFSMGVSDAMRNGLLPGANSPILLAFFIASTLNVTAGTAMMIGHRLTDTYLDIKYEKPKDKVSWMEVVQRIDWNGMVNFVLFKTIPFFWIPAHTVVFLLPAEYRVLSAAMLSIALGAVLAFSKRKIQLKAG